MLARLGAAVSRAAPNRSSRRCATSSRRTSPIRGASTSSDSMPNDHQTRSLSRTGSSRNGCSPANIRAARTSKEIERRLGALLDAGFDAFIDLTEPGELPPYEPYLPRARALYAQADPRPWRAARAGAHGARSWPRSTRRSRKGRRVYVHCRAGIGRTGTVVACHLIEQAGCTRRNDGGSRELERALAGQRSRGHLARGARDATEQRAFILDCAPRADGPHAARPRSWTPRAPCATASRARCWAWPSAMRWPRTRSSASPAAFAPVGDLLGGGPFDLPRGAWTDDTAMALLLAESLLRTRGFDAQDQVERYARWQREGYGSATGQCVGISANVARALATAQYKRKPFAGSHDPRAARQGPAVPGGARGHVSLRRCRRGRRPRGRGGAHHGAGADGAGLRPAAGRHAPPGAGRAATRPRCCARRAICGSTANTRPEVLAVYEGSYARRTPPEITGGGHIVQALEAALWAFHRGASFREGALLAANLGRDSDVVTRHLRRNSPAPTTA